MATNLSPYLNFDGTARAAMEHYRDCLGGDLQVMTFGDMGAPDGIDPAAVMHSALTTPEGWLLMASDLPPGQEQRIGENQFSVSLSGDDEDRLRACWDALAADATVHVPLERQMWGDVFGVCVDRFGITWMVNISEPQA